MLDMFGKLVTVAIVRNEKQDHLMWRMLSKSHVEGAPSSETLAQQLKESPSSGMCTEKGRAWDVGLSLPV
jgi:hypothetical protein